MIVGLVVLVVLWITTRDWWIAGILSYLSVGTYYCFSGFARADEKPKVLTVIIASIFWPIVTIAPIVGAVVMLGEKHRKKDQGKK